jgi:class 3 adenylate cyclase/tetratricopeptide (TPR) repeat protein
VSVCAACGHEIPEGAKFCPECGAPVVPAAAQREQRKTVTILFCDIAGSTELGESTDPEALRAVLARYFERMKEIVERHGGTVEKFIGDAVMAVFGVPVVHEDDALRACRAAVEMRDALPELGIRGRIGVNTGEVVTGTEERLATGDAVNVAARLEQAAEPGEVLIGVETVRLVGDAVELGEERQLELKGKAQPVAAHPLLRAVGELSRRSDVPIVGRLRERRALDDAWERVLSERACHLFTILGTAGVGKSRLTAEFLASLADVTVVRGRCLSYGEGITYWPVVEAVLQLGHRPSDPRAAAAIDSLLGNSEDSATTEEIAWAFRKLLEESAPLVCVFDDLHWAEPTFLDLVDQVADWSRDASIFLVCIARPELLDRRPTWAGGKLNASTVLLEPLTADETDELIERLLGDAGLGDALRVRIRDAAEGNPLFVEQMLAVVAESPDGDVVVPPRVELGHESDESEILARRAAERLGAAAERAALRHDTTAAVALYERSVTLAPTGPRALERQLRLLKTRADAGDLAGALRDGDSLMEGARQAGDRPRELRARVARGWVAHLAESGGAEEERPVVEEALKVFGALGDDAGLAAAWLLRVSIDLSALRWNAVAVAAERAIEHAERAGEPVLLSEALQNRVPPLLYGPTPVENALAWFEANPQRDPHEQAVRGQLEAMRGNIETARRLVVESRNRSRELGEHLWAAGAAMNEAEIELNCGDPARAAEVALEGVAELERLGEQGWLSTVAGWAAEALHRLGRDDEAWQLTDRAEQAGAADDVITQMLIRQVRAKILTRRGELTEAEQLARAAVELGRPTDASEHKAQSLCTLAVVLKAAERREEALAALAGAHVLFEAKGHTVGVARVEELRAELAASLGA